ncbi:MAG TPA: hypothetical protein VKA35_06210 [Solirubrobacterales bacterium]|nr:hypothetical protein [Solirubrobacterales bacterium]
MLREHVRARGLFIQNDQDLHPQGVGEGFGYNLFYALFFVFGFRHGLFFGSFPGVMADTKTLHLVDQDFHNAPAFSDY